MSAHTPGPWAAHPQALLGVHQPELQCWIPQNRADAMLIAAAPDLMMALVNLRDFVVMSHAGKVAYLDEGNKHPAEVAQAAILKATGGAA